MTAKTVAFHSFGCKLNQSETQSLEKGFAERGYQVVPFKESADYYVIDTCTVTDQADLKCRNIIRKAERQNPDSRVIVTGCMAQMESEKIKEISPNSLVIGTFEKFRMFDILHDVESSDDWEDAIFIEKDHNRFNSANTADISSRTRAFLKIQDGCNYVCSFCIIPYARGKDRSSKLTEVIKQAKQLIADGYQEIVLTGVNIGEYKDADLRIDDLVEKISELDGLKRLRISSIEPNTVTDRLISLVKERSNIMPHFHVPIQSGSSSVLAKMRRHYDRPGIERILDRICTALPNLALGSDFIVGFPQESDADFQDTVSVIEAYPFSYYHTFTFSSRQNTIAARMENHIDKRTKFQRSEYLRKLAEQKKAEYYLQHLGEIHPVLFERINDDQSINGFTENYIKIKVNADNGVSNTIRNVRLLEFKDQTMLAELI
ncbi:MAG: tRNA (N(6)-L-threonylcarbamoyladenosine(37)-C(2))-methylthiotransferase MtaB [Calditrichaeota bacterium]|nr:tRNA (N(6)-L-threonylcarbamoyladenosine(37)-C(2))-methylthiotransferase MtaB [Calditrichota bacterium]